MPHVSPVVSHVDNGGVCAKCKRNYPCCMKQTRINMYCTVCNARTRRNEFRTCSCNRSGGLLFKSIKWQPGDIINTPVLWSTSTAANAWFASTFILPSLQISWCCFACALLQLSLSCPGCNFTGQAAKVARPSGHGNLGTIRSTQMRWMEVHMWVCEPVIRRCLLQGSGTLGTATQAR